MTLYQAMMNLDSNQHIVVQVAGEVLAKSMATTTVIVVLYELFRRIV